MTPFCEEISLHLAPRGSVTEVLLVLGNFFTRLITNAEKGRKPKNYLEFT
jgi:hypothetical protein